MAVAPDALATLLFLILTDAMPERVRLRAWALPLPALLGAGARRHRHQVGGRPAYSLGSQLQSVSESRRCTVATSTGAKWGGPGAVMAGLPRSPLGPAAPSP